MPFDPKPLVARILELQRRDGAIAWVDGGLYDPWNHCEAAMGLMAAGEVAAARRALEHLRETQRADGSWRADMGCAVAMTADGERLETEAPPQIVDTNFCAYPALAVWRLFLATRARADLERFFAMVERAAAFVLGHQRASGAVAWRAPAPGEALDDVDALLAGSASIYKSLEGAVRIAQALEHPCDDWARARARLGVALREAPDAFLAKPQHAMDWYYPALSGALPIHRARARLAERWRAFVEPAWGCRCVVDEPWATAAETAELSLAARATGAHRLADAMLDALARAQDENGALWMGRQFALDRYWPMERPSWTAGAALLALEAARTTEPGARLFLETLAEPAREVEPVSRSY